MITNISDLPEFDDHELVAFLRDRKTGLRAVVAIHNTARGPATGGTRYWVYRSEEDAVRDALKLSRAMTYKCAIAGVPYGGGKGVIIADHTKPKKDELLRAYARRINLFGGNFSTGEDVGMTEHDIKVMARESRFINGKPDVAGDLAPWAALGVSLAMRAGLEAAFRNPQFRGRTVAIKGLGKVGMELARLISTQGGRLVGADVNPRAVRAARRKFPKMKIVPHTRIHAVKADVYSPCALGHDFDAHTVRELRSRVICGAANNQLVTDEDGKRLARRGILYIPDYVANAGGLVNVVGEMNPGGYSRAWVLKKVMAIEQTARKIIRLAARSKKPTNVVADRLAEKLFARRRKRA